MAYVYTKAFASQTSSIPAARLLTPSSEAITSKLHHIAEQLRLEAIHSLDLKATLGQVFTSTAVARIMASLLENRQDTVRLLDAGAGTGMLFISAVNHLLTHAPLPKTIFITAYEIDPEVAAYARKALIACERACSAAGVAFEGKIIEQDFIEAAPALTGSDLFGVPLDEPFTHAILNPPYFKIHARSRERLLLRQAGIEATNMYTGFLEVVMRLLAPKGQMIAITPRSFCNGAYFTAFRRRLLDTMALRSIHLFGSRLAVFSEETTKKETLQETLIFSAQKRHATDMVAAEEPVHLAMSDGPDSPPLIRAVAYDQVVNPNDPHRFIHISSSAMETQTTALMRSLTHTLPTLGLSVSTGRVVDFRARAFLRDEALPEDAPLIYPAHLAGGSVQWPSPSNKKPNALHIDPKTLSLLVPNDT